MRHLAPPSDSQEIPGGMLAPGSSRPTGSGHSATHFGKDLPLEWLTRALLTANHRAPQETLGRDPGPGPSPAQAALPALGAALLSGLPLRSTERLRSGHGGLRLARAMAAAGHAGADRDGGPACSPADFAVFGPGRSGPSGPGRPVKYTSGPCALLLRAVWKGECPTRRVSRRAQPCPLHPRAGSERPGQTPGGGQRPSGPVPWPCLQPQAHPSPPWGGGAMLGTHSSRKPGPPPLLAPGK